jgi:hypothetical protein
VPVDSEAG